MITMSLLNRGTMWIAVFWGAMTTCDAFQPMPTVKHNQPLTGTTSSNNNVNPFARQNTPFKSTTALARSSQLFVANNVKDPMTKDGVDDNASKSAEMGDALKAVVGVFMIGSYVFGWAIILGFYFLPYMGYEFQNNNGRLGIGKIVEQTEQVVLRINDKRANAEDCRLSFSSAISADSDLLLKLQSATITKKG